MSAESLAVREAARMLGISPRTVKRLCEEGRLPHFLTPGGHFRFRRVDLDAFAGGRNGPAAAPGANAGGLVQSRRERVEALRLEAEERRAQRELRRLEVEDAEAEARSRTDAEAVRLAEERETERLRLEAAREAEARAVRTREGEAQRRRAGWLATWTDRALAMLPNDAPPSVALGVRQAVSQTLAELGPDDGEEFTCRLVATAVQASLAPWQRRKEIDRIIDDAAQTLPYQARSFDPERPTEWQTRAVRAAAEAVRQLDPSATLAEIRAVAFQAATKICEGYDLWHAAEQHHQRRDRILEWAIPPFELAQEEFDAARRAVRGALEKLPVGSRDSEMRAARDAALAPFQKRAGAARLADRYLGHVSEYIDELGGENGEWDLGGFFDRCRLAEKLKSKLRPALIRELLENDLDEQEAEEFIEERVDAALGLDAAHKNR